MKVWKRCTNCGQRGHFHKECEEPKISIGIICFRYDFFKTSLEFLLVHKKYTFAYTDFIRGNYEYSNINELIELIKGISPTERERIMTIKKFQILWDDIWTSSAVVCTTEKFKKDYDIAEAKFNLLTSVGIHGTTFNEIIQNNPSVNNGPKWEFPKGKRDINESNIKCACREFQEETDISPDEYEIRFEFSPIIDEFVGNNGINYKYIYFVGQSHDLMFVPKINEKNKHQIHEIGDIGWFSLENVLEKINKPGPQLNQLFEKLQKTYIFN
jgi:8-oxo-dGTP pyrophosphatase MutT (NUDIX family)